MNSSQVSVTDFSQCQRARRRILDFLSIRLGISAFVCLLFAGSGVAQTPLTISNIRLDSAGRAIVSVPAVPGSYFILYRGDTVAAISTVTDLESDPTLTSPQQVELSDELALIPAARFYRVEMVSLASPKDSDGDGMDDAYELAYRPVLNPLNAADADLDSDNDGRTNVEEYRARTNPLVANPPPAPASPILDPIAESTQGTLLSLSGSGPVNTTIRVEGAAFLATNSVGADGHFSVPVVLSPNRLNRLLISAIGTNGSTSAGHPVEIIQDSQPPTLFVDFPTNGQEFFSANTMVAGRVGDSLSGYRGLRVWVHSSPSDGDAPLASTQFPVNSPFAATVDVGIGPNGTFERGNVPLALGANVITVIGSDLLGNRTLRRTEVTRQELAGPRITAVDGDRQMANAARTLSAPIIVRVTQPDGSPIANSTLVFDVTRSNGRLRPVNDAQLASPWTNSPSATTNGAMQVRLNTDAAGEARVWWTLGSDAGCANNRVCVTSTGISNSVFFCASATPNAARQLNIGSGNNQKVEVGAQTPEPLRVWASDGLNPAVAAPITFRVVQGGGKLIPGGRDGTPQPLTPPPSTELTVAAGITGHASVGFIAGPDGGQNLIEATFPGQFGLPATFTVYGVARDLDTPGTFSGLILDNTSCPIGNATARLTVANYDRIVMSDGQGQFRFSDVPGGMGHLFVNGATATSLFNNTIPTNSFPALSYAVVTVANAQNSLPTPVLLPRLDPVNAKTYYGTNDITLTCKGIDGLKFTIQANSMRHPDGARVTPDRPAVVSLNQVHHDDIPMPMPDGVAPPFAWTFQPGGAHFDIERPVKVEYPNMSGLAAGSIAYFLSFNHDTERFEIAASGHVTEDGSTIMTDPGSGLTISGWGCNCPPYSVTGECENCSGHREPKLEQPRFRQVPAPRTVVFGLSDCGGVSGIAIPRFEETIAAYCDSAASLWRLQLTDLVMNLFSALNPLCTLYDVETQFQFEGYETISKPLPPEICLAEICPLIADLARLASPGSYERGGLERFYVARALFRHEIEHLKHLEEIITAWFPGFRDDLETITLLGSAAKNPSEAAALMRSSATYAAVVDFHTLSLLNQAKAHVDHVPAERYDRISEEVVVPLLKRARALGCPACGEASPLRPAEEAEANRRNPALNSPVRNAPTEKEFENLVAALPMFRTREATAATWSIAAGGAAQSINRLSGFRVSNVVAPDFFGGGPGTLPDFLSDDPVRVIGVSTVGGTNRYLFSEFFHIRQGQTTYVKDLTFNDTPPRKPERLEILAPSRTLAIGITNQLRVIARYADGTTNEVTRKTDWTSYRLSNPNLATLTPDGVLVPKSPGVLYVTAVNEGATAVTGVNLTAGNALLGSITGILLDTNGLPAGGVTVTMGGAVLPPATTGVDGRFTINDIPTDIGQLSISGFILDGVNSRVARVNNISVSPGVVTDLGSLTLQRLLPGLAWIPPGTFLMGSPTTEPNRNGDETQHSVTLTQGFFMGQYEVTQEEYRSMLGSNPSIYQNGRFFDVPTNTSHFPVETVSWFDATNYCAKLTVRERDAGRLPEGWEYRLPTEAQWEYACRGGTLTPFHYGNKLVAGMANFFVRYPYDTTKNGSYTDNNPNLEQLRRTTFVGSYEPNAWGLYDMHGTVWEWCLDRYEDFGSVALTDPKGPNTGLSRVYRGGSWNVGGRYCRSADRGRYFTSGGTVFLGFRVVLVPVP